MRKKMLPLNLLMSLWLALFLFGSNGCRNTAGNTTQSTTQSRTTTAKDELLFRFEKTACMGQCPVYEAEVYRSGKGVFNGKVHVQPVGRYEFWLPRAVLEHIEQEAERMNFFNLEDKYLSKATDFPSTFLTINKNGRSKTVQLEEGGPERLLSLNQYIHQQILDAVSPTKNKIAPDEEERKAAPRKDSQEK